MSYLSTPAAQAAILAIFLDVPESIAYSRPHERKVRLRPFAVGVNRNLFYCEPGTWCDWISYDAAKFAFSMVILQTHIAVLGAIGSATAVLIPAEKI